jgi:hypothetical protein
VSRVLKELKVSRELVFKVLLVTSRDLKEHKDCLFRVLRV